jgi:leader peptidase (prepilin peptidase) / N-methyltransferase
VLYSDHPTRHPGRRVIFELLVFVVGAAIGSFLNVVVYRLPEGMSLLFPPSRCPYCLTRLKPYENVPVLGWLLVRGRCNHCHTPISIRYPLVELATGLLFVIVFWRYGYTWTTVGYWAFFSWLLALSLIDFDTMLLPHPLTGSGLLLGLGFQVAIAALSGFDLVTGLKFLTNGLLGAVLGLWVFDLIGMLGTIALRQDAMGGGDGKMAAMIGAWLGWKMMLLSSFLSCAFGAAIGGGAIALGILGRRQHLPFGPFLALGAAVTTLYGEAILQAYLSWIGLAG